MDASTVSAGIAAVSAAISPGSRRVPDLVPHRRGLPGLSGVAALAGRFHLPALRSRCRLAAGDGRTEFARCSSRTSVTAGTVVDRTRTPLTVWFTACWLFATQKDGISALSLQRTLEIGSYQTAWAMPGRPRSVLVRPGRNRLSGTAEVDETYIGGEEPGLGCGQPPRSATVCALHRTRADYAAWRGASQLREASPSANPGGHVRRSDRGDRRGGHFHHR